MCKQTIYHGKWNETCTASPSRDASAERCIAIWARWPEYVWKGMSILPKIRAIWLGWRSGCVASSSKSSSFLLISLRARGWECWEEEHRGQAGVWEVKFKERGGGRRRGRFGLCYTRIGRWRTLDYWMTSALWSCDSISLWWFVCVRFANRSEKSGVQAS